MSLVPHTASADQYQPSDQLPKAAPSPRLATTVTTLNVRPLTTGLTLPASGAKSGGGPAGTNCT